MERSKDLLPHERSFMNENNNMWVSVISSCHPFYKGMRIELSLCHCFMRTDNVVRIPTHKANTENEDKWTYTAHLYCMNLEQSNSKFPLRFKADHMEEGESNWKSKSKS